MSLIVSLVRVSRIDTNLLVNCSTVLVQL